MTKRYFLLFIIVVFLVAFIWLKETKSPTPEQLPTGTSTPQEEIPNTSGATTTVTLPDEKTKPTLPPKETGDSSTSYNFSIDETKIYPDGLSLTLLTINDSRCKPDVQCIWAGELAPTFSATGGNFGQAVTMITLGSVLNQATTSHQYTFTLGDVTTKRATLVIN